MQTDIDTIRSILNEHGDFVIAGHTNPDGDAIGACYAMGMGLAKLGKSVKVVLENYHEKFNIISGGELRYTGKPGRCQVFLCLDCAAPDRVGNAKEYMDLAEVTVCIDHHISNTCFGDYNYVCPGTSSTCELIFRVLNGMVPIDTEIGSAIYAGMIYDTGGFRHSYTSAETMEAAASLMRLGIPFSDIYNRLCVQHTFLESKISGIAIDNMSLTTDGKIVYTWLTRSDMKRIGATPQDMENIVEYIMGTVGVEAAFFIYEKKDGELKCSFRSRTADVSRIAQSYGGGGHINASGCQLKGEIIETMERIVEELRKAVEL